jgi:hypothetical protein
MKKKGKNVFDDFAQTFKELKSSSGSKNNEEDSIVIKSIEIESIEQNDNRSKLLNTATTSNFPVISAENVLSETIEQNTIEKKSIEQNEKETKKLGIHPTSIRVVKEELLKALAGRASAEVKIGDIAPLTGLTRRTVDRVCKHLEKAGEFAFERLHRGMKVTYHG